MNTLTKSNSYVSEAEFQIALARYDSIHAFSNTGNNYDMIDPILMDGYKDNLKWNSFKYVFKRNIEVFVSSYLPSLAHFVIGLSAALVVGSLVSKLFGGIFGFYA